MLANINNTENVIVLNDYPVTSKMEKANTREHSRELVDDPSYQYQIISQQRNVITAMQNIAHYVMTI
jgi:hypothetical protein